MRRDDIYDHLAQVYLGKRTITDVKRKKQFNAWLVINILITGIIFTSAFYGLTAFLAQRQLTENKIIFALNNSPIRIKYDLTDPYPRIKNFSIKVPDVNASRYALLNFSIRGT